MYTALEAQEPQSVIEAFKPRERCLKLERARSLEKELIEAALSGDEVDE